MIHASLLRARRRVRGASALLMCVVILVPMLVIGFVMMKRGVALEQELGAESDQAQAAILAEAGIAEAVTAIRNGRNGIVASQAAPARLGSGLFWVEATFLANKQVRLNSVGMSGQGRAALDAVVRIRVDPWRAYGVFSNLTADLKGQFFLDSYDSRLGTYASQVAGGSTYAGSDAVIGSNQSIDVGGLSRIWGSLRPGPTGTAIIGGGSTVSGSTTPATSLVTLAPVTVPPLPAGGALVVGSGTVTLPPGNHRYTSISVANGAALVIRGPSSIVVDGAVTIGNHGKIRVATTGAVSLYAGGDVSVGTKAGIETPTASPVAFSMYLTGGSSQTAVFKPHGDFYGTVYGPNATIQLGNDFVAFGAITGNRVFCQNPKVKVHYDRAIGAVTPSGPVEVDTLYWNAAAFPVPDLLHDRTDPFSLLGVQANSLPKPADAWNAGGFPAWF
ncbi:MAG: hypothetical protein ACKVXR_00360 [Planctomycetota bacterium]